MGLPGSGKTWLGSRIAKHFSIPFWDADVVREVYKIGISLSLVEQYKQRE